MENLMKKNKQKKKIKLIVINMIFIMILAVGIIKSETMNIGITGVNAANATYDMYKPNTWPTNTEISFGNNVYGVRKTGTLTVAAKTLTNVKILTTAGVTGILISGGYWKHGGGKWLVGSGSADGVYFDAWYSVNGNSDCLANTLYVKFTPTSAMTNETYDFWILYIK